MARIDTLANFLTDVASAIKTKTGKTDLITPANFDTEIASIESGGSSKYAPSHVSFYGYNGTDLSDVIATLDTCNMTFMGSMFRECPNIISLDLSSFDTSNVTAMNHMFCNSPSLETINVSNFDTSKVTTLHFGFYNLQKITSLDLSSWYTPNVTDMGYLFGSCKALRYLDIRNFDFTNVTVTDSMFSGVPTSCEIIVKDDAAKTWVQNINRNFTNVKTVAEL